MNKALKLTAGLIAAGTIITATAPSISSFYNVSANELAKGNYSSSKATTLKQAEKRAVSENGEYTHKQTQKDAKVVKTSNENTDVAEEKFNQVADSSETTVESESAGDVQVTTATTDEDNKVAGVKVTNSEDNTTVTVMNDGQHLTVDKTTFDENTGKYTTEQRLFDLNIANNDGSATNVAYGYFSYTGIAVGRDVLATAIDLGISGLTGRAAFIALPRVVAGALGVSVSTVNKIQQYSLAGGFGYASQKLNPGTYIAYNLDKNGNGWVGVYSKTDRTGDSVYMTQ